jgi:hypothetical protein
MIAIAGQRNDTPVAANWQLNSADTHATRW